MSNQQLKEQIVFLKNQLKRCREHVKKQALHINELTNTLKGYSFPSSVDVNKSEEKNLTQSSDESIRSYYSDDEFVKPTGGRKIKRHRKRKKKRKTRRKKKYRKKRTKRNR